MTSSTTAVSQRGGPQWVQIDPLSFDRALTNVDQQIPDVPELEIPFPGVWQISYSARASIYPGSGALWVTTSLFKNGTLLRGSEALAGIQGSSVGLQSTWGQTILELFDAGDRVTLHAYTLSGGSGSSAHLISNDHGRTTVAAHWVSPT
ncbi:hypothetical protein PS467_00355 [Streptomyces luomodiensis]|uniref:Uncharacterized protein n=1 Tax=Streptomyces luomodiensis TaxID=3026192 RepID=A0ABY9UTS0_9ACTN|nr:hypothetical protein [Streptomyces sp. SCA4-21]WNE93895.1 hypothetical protein PS467_00355 [Streptomyces sp. SCA4-21]